MFNSVWPHRRHPTRLPHPWDSLGKNIGVSCHFLLQCMKVKSESEVTQSCPTLSDPMDCSLPGSSVHGIFQARVFLWLDKEIVFNPLYILDSFVKDKVSIGVWIYLWAFYFVPLIYISVFVPVPYCPNDWLCTGAWSQASWFLQFHSSFSRLLWLFEVFCISIQIVKLFVLANAFLYVVKFFLK